MRTWRVHAWGEPESMRLEKVEAPPICPGEVRVRNRAAALNFFDILQVQGKYQSGYGDLAARALPTSVVVGMLWGGYLQAHPEYSAAVHAALSDMYGLAVIRPSIDAQWPFEDAPRGLRELAARQVLGKAVLVM